MLTRTKWLGLERREDDHDASVVTIREVNDYLLRYTCPACGACRKPKQDVKTATTWRQGEALHCRKCAYVGPVPDDHQALLVARLGVEALQRKEAP